MNTVCIVIVICYNIYNLHIDSEYLNKYGDHILLDIYMSRSQTKKGNGIKSIIIINKEP